MRILLVEDNAADARLSSLAIRRAHSGAEVITVDDGIPALRYLKQEEPFKEAALPDLVLLDLNLRALDGIDVLRWIRQQPRTRDIPVVIFSSSPKDAHVEAAAKADRYVEKPGDLDEYMKIGRVVAEFFSTGSLRPTP